MDRSGVSRGMRRLGLFVLIFALSVAVPGLAASVPGPRRALSPPIPPPPGEPQFLGAEVNRPPNGLEVGEALAQVAVGEAEEKLARETPNAEAERDASRSAYVDLGASEALSLIQEQFPEVLNTIEQDPARAITDARIERVISPTEAQITHEGERALVEGSIPLRVEDESGRLSKVDLDLERTPDGFSPENPIVDVSLPTRLEEGIAVGESGVEVAPAVGEMDVKSVAHRFGEKDVFYPETQIDTDTLAAPTSDGVELFSQLRSAESPGELRFHVRLPAGSQLREDGRGAAEVIQREKPLVVISAPHATDAQGAEVPVAMRVEGSELVLAVDHEDGDFAYPILVDPDIGQDWYNGVQRWLSSGNLGALNYWAFGASAPRFTGKTEPIEAKVGGSERGLFVHAVPAPWGQDANSFGQWTYTAPGADTFFTAAMINPFWIFGNGCGQGTYPEPHDYSGFWNSTWGWGTFNRDQARVYQYGIDTAPGVEDWHHGIGHILVIGLGTEQGNTAPPISCSRDLYAGGVEFWLNDWYEPSISAPTGIPSGWVGASTKFNVIANSSDTGLGVWRVRVSPEGMPAVPEEVQHCTGLAEHPCPNTWTSHIELTAANFIEGESTEQISAEDPTGKVSSTYTWPMKVDRTAPELTLGGPLAEVTQEAGSEPLPQGLGHDNLVFPVYNLTIKAEDGSTKNNETKRSGVKNIEVLLDGVSQKVPWEPIASCPATSCKMEKTFPLKLDGLAPGEHKLRVIATDQLNQPREREIVFNYKPATGIKDEYVMQRFPLPDGENHEGEEANHGPELAVNVVNGNLVYHERDVNVEGPQVDLEVERFYNSQLPTQENTEWGDGWTLAQTPELDPVDTGGSPAPDEAELLDASGAVDSGVQLPTESGGEHFDPALRATITKEAGGYEVTDQSGETDMSIAFDEGGTAVELRTEGPATVDFEHEAGELSEIAVDDPTSSAEPPPAPPALPTSGTPFYSSAFGVSGAANGQFSHPADIARDAKGNLWVVDQGHNRVEKFSSKGEYVLQFGTTGAGNGQLSGPTSIAVDAKGNLWVADSGNNRIEEFNEKGEYVAKAGGLGAGNGQFSSPGGIAIDSKGNLWIADTGNGRVQKLNENREFLKVIGSKGSGAGQLGEPTGIDIGPEGKVWIADAQNNRVTEFSESGEFIRQFGSEGTGNAEFNHPAAIAIDSKGQVWVGDQGNARVQAFNQSGEYLTRFGSAGSGAGQFSFSRPIGIALDSLGHLWVVDANNNRVQKWTIRDYLPEYTLSYASAFGSTGTANGQFSHPADVARDASGNLWVVDEVNNRIQEFSEKGAYLGKFGSSGTGNGKLSCAAGVAIDAKGNFWVVEKCNNRVQEFSPAGVYVRKFGSLGAANGQFHEPEGIAVDAEGNVWVSDTGNNRIEEFNEKGEFIRSVGSAGAGAGQLSQPRSIDVGSHGNVWVADSGNNRIEEFSPDGDYVAQVGSKGSGPGQLQSPSALDVDQNGVVWVADTAGNRIEQFGEEGEFIGQFGSSGSGSGQFSLSAPAGILADPSGRIWVTDPGNNRLEEWATPLYEATEEVLQASGEPNDPAVEVEVSAGLVRSVEGDQSGESTYSFSGDDLVSHDGPQGETKYEYDSGGRMTKVELPNGTKAEIKYEPTYHRVSSVAVTPAGGSPKTTTFSYTESPHRTTVTQPGSPTVTYDIGIDGSVLEWWNAVKPPEIDPLGGSLAAAREELGKLSQGVQNLEVQALSAAGIASIEIIANGNTVVKEKRCSQDLGKEGTECEHEALEWVIETGNLSPGILQLEVMVTDANGFTTAERFWVDIPYTSVPPPGEAERATFSEIKSFREAYGLDRDLNLATEEQAINRRIFNLMGAWDNPHTPEGEVARSSAERWGVPLRPIDVSEMEYREWYMQVNIPLVEAWVENHRASTYAGYYVDHRNGGILHIGFTSEQAAALLELQEQTPLVAMDRLAVYSSPPLVARKSLIAVLNEVEAAWTSDPVLASLVNSAGVDEATDTVEVTGTDPVQIDSHLKTALGANAPIREVYEDSGEQFSGRYHLTGRILAGDHFWEYNEHTKESKGCTSGFGAWEKLGTKANGEPKLAAFMLTAGHCAQPGEYSFRSAERSSPAGQWKQIGIATRTGLPLGGQHYETDGSAVRLEDGGLMPYYIYLTGQAPKPVGPAGTAMHGETLCFSGAKTNRRRCGEMVGVRVRQTPTPGRQLFIITRFAGLHGDSGAPVWSPRTGQSVGLLSGGPHDGRVKDWVTPLVLPRGQSPEKVPGILNAPGMGSLNLAVPGP